MTDVMEQNGGATGSGTISNGTGRTGPEGDIPATGTAEPDAANRIAEIRARIDEIDRALIELWQERATLSREVGATRMASGGTRLVLSREQEILERFRSALGADGTQLALLLLRAGRGPL
jgi:chorismate mutase